MRLMSSQSGFGWVYEAYERNLPRILKVLKQEYNQNEKVLETFSARGPGAESAQSILGCHK